LHEERFIDRELHQPRGERANLSCLDTHGLAVAAFGFLWGEVIRDNNIYVDQ
jgi:hypothetical protein